MLIQLTSASSGKPIIINTDDVHRISEPQGAADGQYANSRTILEYNRPHPKPVRPGQMAFDFVREEVSEVAAMIFGPKA